MSACRPFSLGFFLYVSVVVSISVYISASPLSPSITLPLYISPSLSLPHFLPLHLSLYYPSLLLPLSLLLSLPPSLSICFFFSLHTLKNGSSYEYQQYNNFWVKSSSCNWTCLTMDIANSTNHKRWILRIPCAGRRSSLSQQHYLWWQSSFARDPGTTSALWGLVKDATEDNTSDRSSR